MSDEYDDIAERHAVVGGLLKYDHGPMSGMGGDAYVDQRLLADIFRRIARDSRAAAIEECAELCERKADAIRADIERGHEQFADLTDIAEMCAESIRSLASAEKEGEDA